MTWQERAACIGAPLDWFFPPSTANGITDQYKLARELCARCPVVERCGQYAIDNHCRDGMFGGKTPQERGVRTAARTTRGRPMGPDGHAKRLALYEAGLDDRTIARKLNVAQAGITSWRRRHQLPTNWRRGEVS